MQQLSGLDAAFLYSETPNVPMHIGGLSIWDPSTAPGGKVSFRRIVQTINERAHLAPHLRQRLLPKYFYPLFGRALPRLPQPQHPPTRLPLSLGFGR